MYDTLGGSPVDVIHVVIVSEVLNRVSIDKLDTERRVQAFQDPASLDGWWAANNAYGRLALTISTQRVTSETMYCLPTRPSGSK